MSGDWAPSFRAARLFRKTSQKGNTYFVGRMGGVRVTLVKSKDTAENGDEIWSLMFAEAPAARDGADVSKSDEERLPRSGTKPKSDAAAMRDWQRPAETEIPF